MTVNANLALNITRLGNRTGLECQDNVELMDILFTTTHTLRVLSKLDGNVDVRPYDMHSY